MRDLFRMAGLVLAMMLAMAGAAFADHMTGRYIGIGEASGTTIDLVQTGQQITATLTGGDRGQLTGRQTDDNTAAGVIDLVNIGRIQFESELKDDIMTFVLYGSDGPVTFEFERAGDEADATPTNSQDTDAPETDKPIWYYTVDGGQNGPVTLDALLALVDDGTVSGSTMIWKKGDPAWIAAAQVPELAAALPPPTPVTSKYYVAVDGERQGPIDFDQVVALIEGEQANKDTLAWTPGQGGDWAALSSFEEFADALTAPPPLPEVTEVVPPPLPADEQPPALPPTDAPPDLPPAIEEETAPPAETSDLSPVMGQLQAMFEEEASSTDDIAADNRDAVVACAMDAIKGVSEDDLQVMIDTAFQGSDEQMQAFEEANPGVLKNVFACDKATAENADVSEAAPILPALQEVLGELAKGEFPDSTDAQIAEVVACSADVLRQATTDEQQLMVDTKISMDDPKMKAFADAHPEMGALLGECGEDLTAAKTANPAEEQTEAVAPTKMGGTTVGIGDGRMLHVSGNGSVSVSTNNTGSTITVGDTSVEYSDGTLTINGENTDYPEFKFNLNVTIADDGKIDVQADQ